MLHFLLPSNASSIKRRGTNTFFLSFLSVGDILLLSLTSKEFKNLQKNIDNEEFLLLKKSLCILDIQESDQKKIKQYKVAGATIVYLGSIAIPSTLLELGRSTNSEISSEWKTVPFNSNTSTSCAEYFASLNTSMDQDSCDVSSFCPSTTCESLFNTTEALSFCLDLFKQAESLCIPRAVEFSILVLLLLSPLLFYILRQRAQPQAARVPSVSDLSPRAYQLVSEAYQLTLAPGSIAGISLPDLKQAIKTHLKKLGLFKPTRLSGTQPYIVEIESEEEEKEMTTVMTDTRMVPLLPRRS